MWVATGHRLLCSNLGERRWCLKGCIMGIWVSLGFWSVHFCILCTSNTWFFTGFGGVLLLRGWAFTWLEGTGLHQVPADVCGAKNLRAPLNLQVWLLAVFMSQEAQCWGRALEQQVWGKKGSKDIKSYSISVMDWPRAARHSGKTLIFLLSNY